MSDKTECPHRTPGDPLFKKTILAWSDRNPRKCSRVELRARNFCDLCTTVFPSRQDYAFNHLLPSEPCDSENSPSQELHTVILDDRAFTLKLAHNQTGEAYHVLTCCLLLLAQSRLQADAQEYDRVPGQSNRSRMQDQSQQQNKLGNEKKAQVKKKVQRVSGRARVMIIFEEKPIDIDLETFQNSKQDLTHLLKWYGIVMIPKDSADLAKMGAVSKKNASKVIADVFKEANNCPEWSTRTNQPGMFQQLASQLDTTHCPVDLSIYEQYLSPTWAAKYWLNRYLTLTVAEQADFIVPRKNRSDTWKESDAASGSDRWYKRAKLPKRKDVGRLAVLHVRLTKPFGGNSHATSSGREMDDANLIFAAASVGRANRVACQAAEDTQKAASKEVWEALQETSDRIHALDAPLPDRHLENQVITEAAYESSGYAIEDSFKLFTHIIVYGDFDSTDGPRRKKLVNWAYRRGRDTDETITNYAVDDWMKWNSSGAKPEKAAGSAKDPVKVMFISSPWQKDQNDKVDAFWAKYRQYDFKHLNENWGPSPADLKDSDFFPKHVKTLGIWSALRERYGCKVCVIGHRSGFVEGAGLIGIPIFYLNNERPCLPHPDNPSNADKQKRDAAAGTASAVDRKNPGSKANGGAEDNTKHKWKPGELLWRRVKDPEKDRLRELSSVMNTIIFVEALKGDKCKEEKGEIFRVDTGEPDCKERKCSVSPHRSHKPSTRAQNYVTFENELAAALFMYMCCDLQVGPPPDSVDPGSHRQDNPGWTARVDMMNDLCESQRHTTEECKIKGHEPSACKDTGHKPGNCRDSQHADGEASYQTGQEWLRRRHDFAIAVLPGHRRPGGRAKFKPRLCKWSGIREGKWKSAPREAYPWINPSMSFFGRTGGQEDYDISKPLPLVLPWSTEEDCAIEDLHSLSDLYDRRDGSESRPAK